MPGLDDTIPALRSLSARYARALDSRDPDLFVSVFHPDAQIVVCYSDPEREPVVTTGHAEMRTIAPAMTRYTKTFHTVAQATYDVDGDGATGEVYCVAHHLITDHEGATFMGVFFIRYEDQYARTQRGEWKITIRRLVIEWGERRPISLADPMRRDGVSSGTALLEG
jgi:hypothetical protein